MGGKTFVWFWAVSVVGGIVLMQAALFGTRGLPKPIREMFGGGKTNMSTSMTNAAPAQESKPAAAQASGAKMVQPEDLPQLCDAFYIGGTKNGLLFGEAMVIVNDALKPNFRRAMKRNGAMLAKGRLLGVQFAAAMEHDLWLELGRHADAQAQRIAAAVRERGIAMYVPSPTNQIFPILSDAQIARLQEQVAFYTTARVDAAHQAVRFVTSWATTDAQVDALLAVLAQVLE